MNLPNHGPHAATTINVLNSDTGMLRGMGESATTSRGDGYWQTIAMVGVAYFLGLALLSQIRSNNPPRRYRRRRSVR